MSWYVSNNNGVHVWREGGDKGGGREGERDMQFGRYLINLCEINNI